MSDPRQIAVVSATSTDLADKIAGLAGHPRVRTFADLYTDVEALSRFQPAVVFLRRAELAEADAGAIALLQRLLPELSVVLVCPRAREVALGETCQRLAIELLPEPFTRAQLAGVVAQALDRQPREVVETMHDLARGIADEINNPLMYVSGHLQLLAEQIARQPESRRQIESMQAGLERIRSTVDKLHLLSAAADSGRHDHPVDLAALVREIAKGSVPLTAAAPHAVWVRGEPDLLAACVRHLGEVATALTDAEGRARLSIDPGPDPSKRGPVRILLELDGDAIAAWRLPHTFEPYYLNRFLRGTTHGLNLFVVQAIAQGHGGQALARRAPDGRVALEILLPAAPPGEATPQAD